MNITIALAEFLKPFRATQNGFDPDDECSGGVGEIEGLGHVPAWVARAMVADFLDQTGTGFRAVIFDQDTGTFLAASSTKYRPPSALERHVKLRDRTCRFPGCRPISATSTIAGPGSTAESPPPATWPACAATTTD